MSLKVFTRIGFVGREGSAGLYISVNDQEYLLGMTTDLSKGDEMLTRCELIRNVLGLPVR